MTIQYPINTLAKSVRGVIMTSLPSKMRTVNVHVQITWVQFKFPMAGGTPAMGRIASDKLGSGNTANIGSIVDIDDLKNENGIFSRLGEEWFDEYWINHGSATMIKDGKTLKITTLKDFLEFKGRIELWEKIVAKTSKKKKK